MKKSSGSGNNRQRTFSGEFMPSLILLTVFWIFACGSTAYPAQAMPNATVPGSEEIIPVEFYVERVQYAEGPKKTETEGGKNQIVVKGNLTMPNPCHRTRSTATKNGANIILRFTSESNLPKGTSCMAVIAELNYRAVIKGIEPGIYHLRVIHEHLATVWPAGTVVRRHTEVLKQNIEVQQ